MPTELIYVGSAEEVRQALRNFVSEMAPHPEVARNLVAAPLETICDSNPRCLWQRRSDQYSEKSRDSTPRSRSLSKKRSRSCITELPKMAR
jgi:hypothetical protein